MSSSLLDQRREALYAAAETFVAGGKTTELQRGLCDAASAYDKERQAHFRPKQNQEAAKHVVPFGRTKGTPIGEAATKDLEWLLGVVKARIEEPDKAKFRAENEELVAVIERELETR